MWIFGSETHRRHNSVRWTLESFIRTNRKVGERCCKKNSKLRSRKSTLRRTFGISSFRGKLEKRSNTSNISHWMRLIRWDALFGENSDEFTFSSSGFSLCCSPSHFFDFVLLKNKLCLKRKKALRSKLDCTKEQRCCGGCLSWILRRKQWVLCRKAGFAEEISLKIIMVPTWKAWIWQGSLLISGKVFISL